MFISKLLVNIVGRDYSRLINKEILISKSFVSLDV